MDHSDDLGVLLSGEFFHRDLSSRFHSAMREAPRFPARVTKRGDYSVLPEVRNTNRLHLEPCWHDLFRERIAELKPRFEGHFMRKFGACQEPQFMAYSEGHFFRAHRDVGAASEPPLITSRSLSIVVLLNPGQYEGGTLILHDMGVPGSRIKIAGRPGGFIAFHPVVLHEVTPVTRGERYSIATWLERAVNHDRGSGQRPQ